MKSNILKFKALALSLMLAFSLFSCSDDGDDPDSFLEKNGGTVWKISESGLNIYAQINNSESNPFEFWASFGEDSCYEHESVNNGGEVEVLENTESTLKVRIDDSETEYTILTFTVSGNILTVTSEYFEDGEMEREIIPLKRTDDDTDDLELCEI